jgi:asparagine synthase (glutamine-hydrolysing)
MNMCGITGFLAFDNQIEPQCLQPTLDRMTSMLTRRGPDDAGSWIDSQGRLAFGFRRLAVLDLSTAGNQPMHSQDGRSILVMNGEIYNFKTLRQALENQGLAFRTRTDSEVLLEALNTWGLDDTLERANGMFAFAWYERDKKQLTLARDHAGIKPLYYAIHLGRGLTFASQFNVLLWGPWGIPGEVNYTALRLYLKLHHLPPPHTLHENAFQLEPGTYLRIDPDNTIEKKRWWQLPRRVEGGFTPVKKAIDQLAGVLDETVARQRIADVPLGVLLSGGVDSPLVSALTRQQVGPELKAFTISIPGWWQDESKDARRYAQAIGLDHHVIEISGEQALGAIEAVIQAQHEPFADFSIIPTLLVSQYAKPKITVALSGDGGDELFFGYERPLSLLRNGADFRWPRLARLGLYSSGKYGLIPKKSDVIVNKSPGHYYFGVNSRLSDGNLKRLAPEVEQLRQDLDLYAFDGYRGELDLANYSRYVEFYGQLQRGLKKVDMASSHYALEVRVPLLDRQVIDLSLQMDPFEMMHGGQRKWVLRKLLETHVPAEIIPTSKRGFAIPLGDWLRGPLKDRVEGTLFDRPLYPQGVFDRSALEDYWKNHLSGAVDHKWGLWTLLALQWWAMAHLEGQA